MTRVRTKSGRLISLDTQRAAARAYVKASEKAGEPVPQHIRDFAECDHIATVTERGVTRCVSCKQTVHIEHEEASQ